MIYRDLSDLPIAVQLEAHFDCIRAEIGAAPAKCFEPWPQPEYIGSWRMMPLRYDDRPPGFQRTPEANCSVVPLTARLLLADPMVMRAAVSVLGPQSHIPPHDGVMADPPLRTHLGISIPEASGLRVGDDRLRLPVGKLVGFDPRRQHEAANMSTTEIRVVLIVDLRLSGVAAAKYLAPVAV